MNDELRVDAPRRSLLSAPSIAGPDGVTARVKEARAFFAEAVALYEAGKNREAASTFNRAAEMWEAEDAPALVQQVEQAAMIARENALIAIRP